MMKNYPETSTTLGQIRKECLTKDEALMRYKIWDINKNMLIVSLIENRTQEQPDKGKQTDLGTPGKFGNSVCVHRVSTRPGDKWEVVSGTGTFGLSDANNWILSLETCGTCGWHDWRRYWVLWGHGIPCEAEKFPNPGQSDCACVLFLFLVVCTYSLHFRGI